jgi:malate permease and related proteins
MENFSLLFISFFIGYSLKKYNVIHKNHLPIINQFIIYVSLPSQILVLIPTLKIEFSLIYPISIAYIVLLFSFIFFKILNKFKLVTDHQYLSLSIVCGLGNTSFVGLPLIEAYFGEAGMKIGVTVDQLGTFLALSLIGIPFLLIKTSGQFSYKYILKRILFFPPFITLFISIFFVYYPTPDFLYKNFYRLSLTLAPLALFSVGAQLEIKIPKKNISPMFFGLLYKLILAPTIISILFVSLLKLNGLIIKISIFEAAMAPMITAAILVSDADVEKELTSSVLAYGILLSFLSSYFWVVVINRIL